ncbi:hypothetical protein SS1G_12165 [Sclerotinia sclerotiorum 1980 UF-70]|uniref:Uncharacterized protein n=2 Tax=Sclerotinia sclerotiorum (strain ATCC 18683 / 1980 / Ss-1) TaxID=665079 RepID=A0A1D9Q326_SCLS1|nr:hypothetical protein SS1G_12165 [Sclerotinia sclerotiorum 1980 UF-70]APA09370.1 hypothetical protein sscle_05g041400 [Sclerotinia sclerotiorum 1980 UF-70]EDN95959.1 hypothetical protein SS1G_12165 [Sclerotinia sclerotiorum 1980 UF-70]
MKLTSSFLLPLLASTACAASDSARAYIFESQQWPNNAASPPSLSPNEARLVLAQRLGVSRFHDVGSVDANAINHINKFGGQSQLKSLFKDAPKDRAAELVMIVEGVSEETAGSLLDAWSSIKPAFTISNPPSVRTTQKLADDLELQVGGAKKCTLDDAINPFADKCWNGKSKIMHIDLNRQSKDKDFINTSFERLTKFASKAEMNVLVILMPDSRRGSGSYGSYVRPSQKKLSSRQQFEEPMSEFVGHQVQEAPSSNSSYKNNTVIKTTLPVCHASLDSCTSSTNNCSSMGACYKKYTSQSGDCFACRCDADSGRGGSACQKRDISGPFWLIFISSFVLVGLVSWGISMLYSIGDEKLPGVIGAGVSSNKAR